MTDRPEPVEQAYRQHWGRLLAGLAAQFRSFDLAEDALGEAFAQASRHWNEGSIPSNPAGWLRTTANRVAIDTLRRQATAGRKARLLITDDSSEYPHVDVDHRLQLIFTCCHPALAEPARVALTLRYVAGLSTAQIAALFLTTESTMAARLTRAKHKITEAGIPHRVPEGDELPDRLAAVLKVIYLAFTQGYLARTGDDLLDDAGASEAIRLSRLLVDLMPTQTSAASLLALLLLQYSRRDTRVSRDGALVRLPDQDRRRWRRDEIAEGIRLLRWVARRSVVDSRYFLEARIAAEHAVAATAADTNWERIAALYARLEHLTHSPIVRLNRAVAQAEAHGPAQALLLLDGLDAQLPRHHMLPALRADLLERLGERTAAIEQYDRAIALTVNMVERRFLESRRDRLRK